MTPFLKQVASHYFEEAAGDISRRIFVFPNRRALIFFRKYLAAEAAARGLVLQAPVFITIGEFFSKAGGLRTADRLTLLLDLYACYAGLRKDAEPLDEFIFWGDMLLSDFSDVDKYLVDPEKIFTNVADFKGLQDYGAFLSERQAEAVRRFVEHFTVRPTDKKYKRSFLKIWDILHPLYKSFNERLEREGRAYEGKVYRTLVSRIDAGSAVDVLSETFGEDRGYVFIGLNALSECERKVLARMRDAGIAEFCWDWSSDLIRDPEGRAGFFMADNVARFPQAFTPDAGEKPGVPEFNVLSIPSTVGQASQLREILRRSSGTPDIRTAVVLPDEGMLLPVLNSIPPEIADINVTMGYPMGGSAVWDLMDQIAAMQMHLRCKDGEWMFYHRQVYAIFSNPVFRAVASDASQTEAISLIRKEARYYIPQEDLDRGGLMSLIFRPVVKDSAGAGCVSDLEDYQTEVVDFIGRALRDNPSMALETDFAREFHLAITRLRDIAPQILPATYFRLLRDGVARESVPFKGEPLRGLQIMGPLETRALDFDTVIILGCNEGVFPRRSVGESFIPAELRKGFGLPTYEYQDAVWAYYFYRLIQRARTVWMVYDSGADVGKSGEESRYIRQIGMHYGLPVRRYVFGASLRRPENTETDIPKTEENVKKMRKREQSASSLQTYLACPAQYFYKYVEGLKAEEDVQESMDDAMTGSVFHKTMEKLYRGHARITRDYLKSIGKEDVRRIVEDCTLEVMHGVEVTGRDLVLGDMVCRYVHKTIERDLELMDRYRTDGFTLYGVERGLSGELPGGFRFAGIADRIDSFTDGVVRIVDYKTGKVLDEDLRIDEGNAQKTVDALFRAKNNRKPKIALQLYLYDRFIPEEFRGMTVINSIYRTSKLFTEDVPEVKSCPEFRALMDVETENLLSEMADTSVPFRRTDDKDTCKYCDFKTICGR